MSETWSGPGSWMASDGLWYPPRETNDMVEPDDDSNSRWSRRHSDDEDADDESAPATVHGRPATWMDRPDRPDRSNRTGPPPLDAVATDDQVIDLRDEVVAAESRREAARRAYESQVQQPEVAAQPQPRPVKLVDEAAETIERAESPEPDSETAPPKTEVMDLRAADTGAQSETGPDAPDSGGGGPANDDPDPSPDGHSEPVSEPGPAPLAERLTSFGRDRGSRSTESEDESATTIPLAESMARKLKTSRNKGERSGGDRNRKAGDAVRPALGYVESPTADQPVEAGQLRPPDLPAMAPIYPPRRSRGFVLLTVATLLAVLSGILGALWLRERSTTADLREELARTAEPDPAGGDQEELVEGLQNDLNTLQLQNEDLARRIQELTAIVPEVPVGRVSTIDIPLDFQPRFIGEVRGRFIALSTTGQYVIWADGADGEITDSGTIDGRPLGLVALRDVSWVSTAEGTIQLVAMDGGEDPEPYPVGTIDLLTRSSRSMWGYATDTGQLQRFRQTNGRLLTTVDLPTVARKITAGAGAVWVLGDDGVVYRVNTADFTVSPLDAGESIVSIAAGADALWSLSAADGSLRRLDAVSGEVLVTVPVGRDPIAAVVSGNSVWVALRSGSKLIEVDTRTSAVVSRTDLPGVPVRLTRGETGVLVTLEGDTPLVRVASVVPDVADAETDGADDPGDGDGE